MYQSSIGKGGFPTGPRQVPELHVREAGSTSRAGRGKGSGGGGGGRREKLFLIEDKPYFTKPSETKRHNYDG